MDDFVIFGNSKKELHICKHKIKMFLKEILDLELPSNKCSIFPVTYGVNFLGYNIFYNNIKIRKKNYKNFIKRTVKLNKNYKKQKIDFNLLKSSVCSYLGYCKLANTFKFNFKIFTKNFKDLVYLITN